jgi:uncharacterized protein (DUF924 family)
MTSPSITAVAPENVLDFWLADGVTLGWPSQEMNKRWFTGGPELDQAIGQQFGRAVAQAQTGGLVEWEAAPLARLALIIVLDQFSRNMFRGGAQAFAGDARAQQLVLQTLANQEDRQLPLVGRLFVYMPLMHAENPALQDQCVVCFTQLVAEAPESLQQRLQSNLDYAHRHQAVISRFGRFPHRNAVLGRSNTPQEEEFLLKGPRFGQ